MLRPLLAAAALWASTATTTALSSGRALRAVDTACFLAQATLGEDKVDTAPLDQAVVDANWSETCQIEPHCIIQPTSAQDVAAAVKIVRFNKVKFAVRSGGHSPNPGWAAVGDEGILFDLSKLNSVSLSENNLIVSVGPGADWVDVSNTLEGHGVSAVGARAPYVGIGGSVLGGAYSYFISEYGLGLDNVKNYQVVLANGCVVNANEKEHPDLYWALKGGGPNFGIVTRLDLYTVPIDQMWYYALVFARDSTPDVLDALAQWQKEGASDSKSNVLFSASLDTGLLLLTYAAPAVKPDIFAPFYAVPPLAEAIPPTNSTIGVMNNLIAGSFGPTPGRHDYRGVSSKIDAQLYKDMYNYWIERAQATKTSHGVNQTFTLQHISANVALVGNKKGGNALNIPEEDHQWWTTLVDWDNEADDDIARSVSIATTTEWEKVAIERGLDIEFLYLNDAGRDQNPIGTYGSENVEKLKKIAKKYDPGQFFQTQQNDGFLLSKV